MKVSIGVPVYGVENYIERCARSLFEQTYLNIEYIFIDDCSPDKSISILNKILSEYPERKDQVRIISHNQNMGLATARNTFINNATGEFVWNIDSDDYIERNAVEKLVKKQKETNSDIIIMGAKIKHPAGHSSFYCVQELSKDILVKSVTKGSLPHNIWMLFIKLSLYKQYNIKNIEGYNMGEDYCTVPRLLWYSKIIAYIKEPLYIYMNTNEESYTNVINETKYEQSDYNIMQVRSFFKHNKDYKMVELVDAYWANAYTKRLVSICRIGGHKSLFNKLKDTARKQKVNNKSAIPFIYLPFLYCDNYKLLHIYAKFSAPIKHLLEHLRK